MAMKINELMIGDYICLDGDINYDNPIRIQQIGYQGENEIVADSDVFGVEDIIPIPLTEEILAKNGFKKESQTIDGDYCKYTLPGFALNWCDTDGFWYQNGDITPNHVHTLQHLLRLAGVQKEIEL